MAMRLSEIGPETPVYCRTLPTVHITANSGAKILLTIATKSEAATAASRK